MSRHYVRWTEAEDVALCYLWHQYRAFETVDRVNLVCRHLNRSYFAITSRLAKMGLISSPCAIGNRAAPGAVCGAAPRWEVVWAR